MIAAAYIRVSTSHQTEYSPAAQLDDIRSFCAQKNYTLPEEFIFWEEGISGKEAENRPAFQEMMRQARKKENHIQCIIVHKFDRFARSKEDAVLYKALLKKSGIRVLSVKEPIPADDKFAVIYESILEAMAEYYSLNLAEEVQKGMSKKAQLGEWQSRPPFGYHIIEKRLSPNAADGPAVTLIFSSFLEGKSLKEIAETLNSMGYHLSTGTPFTPRQISYILQNPVYKGVARWTLKHPKEKTFSIPGAHPPLVEETLWQQANALLSLHKHSRPPNAEKRQHWLSGLLYCSACGSPMVLQRTGETHLGYQCKGYKNGICHHSHYISLPQLEKTVLSELNILASNCQTPHSSPKKEEILEVLHSDAPMPQKILAASCLVQKIIYHKEKKYLELFLHSDKITPFEKRFP